MVLNSPLAEHLQPQSATGACGRCGGEQGGVEAQVEGSVERAPTHRCVEAGGRGRRALTVLGHADVIAAAVTWAARWKGGGHLAVALTCCFGQLAAAVALRAAHRPPAGSACPLTVV